MYRRAGKLETALGCLALAIQLERRAGKELEAIGVLRNRHTSAASYLHLSALLTQMHRYANCL